MERARREVLGAGGVVLHVRDRPGPPPLRFETADGGRLVLWQGTRPLLLGVEEKGGCSREGLYTHRLDGYRSPLPPVRAARMRDPGNWVHQYGRWLEEAEEGPLHDARWHLRVRDVFPPYVWRTDFERAWPACHLAWCRDGWQGVVPLRPLSLPDAPRVKAYRRHAREGMLAPVLLWWATPLDGWLILDGHDRALASLAEDRTPPCVVLARVPDDAEWRRTAAEVTEGHEQRLRQPLGERQRAALVRAYDDVMSSLPYDGDDVATRTWPLPGGTPAWDELAVRAMFEFPCD